MSHDVILINFQVEFMIARGKDDKDKVSLAARFHT